MNHGGSMLLATRESHLKYVNKITPYLVVSFVVQSYIYQRWAPAGLASEVIIFIGCSLALLIAAMIFFDHHHKIIFHENHLEVRFDLIQYHQEVLYRDIQWVEITRSKHGFATLVVTGKDHVETKLFYLDNPLAIKNFLDRKAGKLPRTKNSAACS
jgi:hypothetical protein